MDKKLSDQKWLYANEKRLAQLFPEAPTPCSEINTTELATGLKLMGINIKSEYDTYLVMSHLRNIGILVVVGTMFFRGRIVNRELLMKPQCDDSYWVRFLLAIRRGIVRFIN